MPASRGSCTSGSGQQLLQQRHAFPPLHCTCHACAAQKWSHGIRWAAARPAHRRPAGGRAASGARYATGVGMQGVRRLRCSSLPVVPCEQHLTPGRCRHGGCRHPRSSCGRTAAAPAPLQRCRVGGTIVRECALGSGVLQAECRCGMQEMLNVLLLLCIAVLLCLPARLFTTPSRFRWSTCAARWAAAWAAGQQAGCRQQCAVQSWPRVSSNSSEQLSSLATPAPHQPVLAVHGGKHRARVLGAQRAARRVGGERCEWVRQERMGVAVDRHLLS